VTWILTGLPIPQHLHHPHVLHPTLVILILLSKHIPPLPSITRAPPTEEYTTKEKEE